MRVVVALGGNALLRRGQAANAATQRANAAAAATAIGEIAGSHAVIVTHGSGPQVGLLALQSESVSGIPPSPLDVLDAETEGMIGYLLEQELINVLGRRAVATLLTQVAVDRRDPAFGSPSKPIGPAYDGRAARRLAAERGWSMASDGERYRRVVASPEPLAIVELEAIAVLVAAGILVVCVGGGGIPVRADDAGRLHGVEAVIDKDLSAALLARQLRADALLLLTDVPHVEVGWRTSRAHPLRQVTPRQLRALRFAPGSMAPKVEAACRFVECSGGVAAIGALEDGAALLRGERGTIVRASAPAPGEDEAREE